MYVCSIPCHVPSQQTMILLWTMLAVGSAISKIKLPFTQPSLGLYIYINSWASLVPLPIIESSIHMSTSQLFDNTFSGSRSRSRPISSNGWDQLRPHCQIETEIDIAGCQLYELRTAPWLSPDLNVKTLWKNQSGLFCFIRLRHFTGCTWTSRLLRSLCRFERDEKWT